MAAPTASAPESTAFIVSHPSLGTLNGLIPASTPSVAQFRNIPFGRIPARFRQSVLATTLSDDERDCTEYGTICPQFDQGSQMYGGKMRLEKPKKYDEFSCLNLSISAPKKVIEQKAEGKGFPVMVYVHGGGFVTGRGNASTLHDTSRMVELSIQDGNPVVMVNIHYRLHIFGLLACQDLLDESIANNEPRMNFSLHDQRMAFKWIKTYISGFGGDPNNMTAYGESAGSLSLVYHMCSTVPLFNRAILMSGTTSAAGFDTITRGESTYQKLLAFLEINEADGPGRLGKLREVPAEKFLEAIVAIKWFPTWPWDDTEFFPNGSPGMQEEAQFIQRCDWVDSVIIGDCIFEGFVFQNELRAIQAQNFILAFTEIVGSVAADKILPAYGIKLGMDQGLFSYRLLILFGDLTFNSTNHQLIRQLASMNNEPTGNKKKLYRYTITARNPFPGSHFQISGHHSTELIFLFMTLTDRYPTPLYNATSLSMARAWTKFGAGLEPWDEFRVGDGEEEKIAVADNREGWVVRTRADDDRISRADECGKRRYAEWEILQDALAQAIASGIDNLHRMTLETLLNTAIISDTA